MIENGLRDELTELYEEYSVKKYIFFLKDNKSELFQIFRHDYEIGLLQSIGFKEFHKYLSLPIEKRNSDEGRKLFEEG